MATVFDHLPPSAFWRSGVADSGPFGLSDLFQPRFPVTRDMAVATAGSCFAQHVGRALRGAGLAVLDVEPAPPGLDNPAAYGFGLYSGRYGNIYTARQLRQLLQDTTTGHLRPQAIWHRDGRPHDALRPGIEPGGFASVDELRHLRAFHLHRLRDLFTRTELFIFTLGMTEAWVDATGTVFPTAPGVIADPPPGQPITFHNFTYPEILQDLTAARDLLHAFNPNMRLLLSVSPVPLTATASGRHVLAATTGSKATLRAVAADFTAAHPDTDYVPSYEVITHPAARGRFFAPNLRSVTQEGVDLVMAQFLHAHNLAPLPAPPSHTPPHTTDPDALICEEALAEAFLK
jgi:hypothetical protein